MAVVLKFRETVLSSFKNQDKEEQISEFDPEELIKIKHATKMLSDLGVYQEIFELPFLERTSSFFAVKSLEKINQNMPLPTYLAFAEGLIQIEGKFAHFYL